jgi:glycosyltransferase involved in cell wall biosynthesis
MIWLASFPRSGNTFFRNVLYEVYGIESSTFHMEPNYPVDERYDQFPVVKTHLLPSQLKPGDPSIKKVYLVREGRDALVSIAHHRKDIIDPGTDFYVNLLEAILAMEGSFFGGWSENVKQWMDEADIVIRFEDLIDDPIREVEKLRSIMDLPEPQVDKLPSFKDLKFGNPKYGAARKLLDERQVEELARKNFRRGKSGSWKDEMPPEIESLFWELHGEQMDALGYARGPIGDAWAARLADGENEPYRILIEGNKTEDDHMDGVRRYLEELIYGLGAFQMRQPEKWRIDILTSGKIEPILPYIQKLESRREAERRKYGVIQKERRSLEKSLLDLKAGIKAILPTIIYDNLSPIYRALPVRDVLRWLRGDTVMDKYRKAWKDASRTHQLVHVPLPQNYYFVSRLNLPFVFTVHDLTHKLYPQYHDKENVQLTEKGMQFIADKAAAIITVSESTRQDLLAHYAIDGTKVQLVYEAANADRFNPKRDPAQWEEVRNRYAIPDGPFLISLSTIEPRKNLINVIRAFLELAKDPDCAGLNLVICGRKGWKHEEFIGPSDAASNRIHFTGHVIDDDLPWLYSYATGLCYLAHYEGFGLPPLEAMRCGTPVIYGNNSSLSEIIGTAGIPADPDDIQDIVAQMKRIQQDLSFRETLVTKAHSRANYFSWLKTAFQTLIVYEKTIKSMPSEADQVRMSRIQTQELRP